MADKNIDEQTRRIVDKKIKPGNELEIRQAAQNQLLAIQAQQKQNISQQRLLNSMDLQNNMNLSQAAMIAQPANNMEIVQAPINPATQQVLSQYGYGKPTIQKSISRSNQQVTKQNITINNYNTTNTSTTNNNQISTGGVSGGPIQGRALSFKQDAGIGKFQVWLNNTFARQNEMAAKRDREYAKHEASLSRNANRMMKKLENSSKVIFNRLDPRNMNRSFKDQLGGLLKMVGFGIIVSNFPKILKKVASIETSFRNYFGIGIEGRSGLKKDLITVFGGDPNGKDGLKTTIKNFGKTLLDLAKERMDIMLDDRREAVKNVAPPKSNRLTDIAKYIGDLTTALLLGSKGELKRTENQIKESGATKLKNQAESKEGFSNFSIKDRHLDQNGQVKNDTSAIAAAANTLNQNAEMSTNTHIVSGDVKGLPIVDRQVQTDAIVEILRNLEEKVISGQEVYVPKSFYDALEKLGINIEKSQPISGRYVIANPKNMQRSADNLDIVADKDNDMRPDFYDDPEKNKLSLYKITKTDFDSIKARLSTLTGKSNFSFEKNDIESLAALNTYLKTLKNENKYNGNLLENIGIALLSGGDHVANGIINALNGGREFSNKLKNSIPIVRSILPDWQMIRNIKTEANNPELDDKLKEYYKQKATVDKTQQKVDEFNEQVKNNQVLNNAKAGSGNVKIKHKFKLQRFWNRLKQDVGIDTGLFNNINTKSEFSDDSTNPDEVDPLQPIPTTGWDLNKSIETLNRNAPGDESTGWCARKVTDALNAGGLYPPRGDAYTFNNGKLDKLGFKKMSRNDAKPYKKGDILVTEANTSHEWGHIAMFNGTQWVSDFKQRNPDGNIYSYDQPNSTLYRMEGLCGDQVTEFGGDVMPLVPKYYIKSSYKKINKPSEKLNNNLSERGGESDGENSNISKLLNELIYVEDLLNRGVEVSAATADEVAKNTKVLISLSGNRSITPSSNSLS